MTRMAPARPRPRPRPRTRVGVRVLYCPKTTTGKIGRGLPISPVSRTPPPLFPRTPAARALEPTHLQHGGRVGILSRGHLEQPGGDRRSKSKIQIQAVVTRDAEDPGSAPRGVELGWRAPHPALLPLPLPTIVSVCAGCVRAGDARGHGGRADAELVLGLREGVGRRSGSDSRPPFLLAEWLL